MKEVTAKQYAAYEKSLDRWKRIRDVTNTLHNQGVIVEGSTDLKIPECAMCKLVRSPIPFGGADCATCVWVEKCNNPDSDWKKIRVHTETLRLAVIDYLHKADEHFRTLLVPSPLPPEPFRFRVKDIIKVVSGEGRKSIMGKTGKVVAMDNDSAPVGVEFQGEVHGGHDCRGTGRIGHCYWLCENGIELVYRGTKEAKDC